jgi:hypothetical protein
MKSRLHLFSGGVLWLLQLIVDSPAVWGVDGRVRYQLPELWRLNIEIDY